MNVPKAPCAKKYIEKHPEFNDPFWDSDEDIVCNVCADLHVAVKKCFCMNGEHYICCENCCNKAILLIKNIWKEREDLNIYEDILFVAGRYIDPVKQQSREEILNSDEFRVYNECLSAIYLWNKPEIKL